jgi:hypothetical protein
MKNAYSKGYSNATVRPSHPCEHSRINILQWILTKLGTCTYLILKRIWNPIDFQSQRSRFKFLGEGIRHALPLFRLDLVSMIYKQIEGC